MTSNAQVQNTGYNGRLRRADWEVRSVSIEAARPIVNREHYAHGASNTATCLHGLFRRGEFWDVNCQGVAWWIPPTRSAAEATYPANWKGVLALSRFVIMPDVPKNAATFLLAGSMRLIVRERWPCLVTYADEWQGHVGTMYLAANWKAVGFTAPEATWILDGRMVSRKAGGKTRTKAEMLALGAEMIGRYRRRKFVHVTQGH